MSRTRCESIPFIASFSLKAGDALLDAVQPDRKSFGARAKPELRARDANACAGLRKIASGRQRARRYQLESKFNPTSNTLMNMLPRLERFTTAQLQVVLLFLT
jgi:hypothetical protein